VEGRGSRGDASQPTQFETTFGLALDASGSRLSVTVAVADEKGSGAVPPDTHQGRMVCAYNPH
jgi:hypothetical protein